MIDSDSAGYQQKIGNLYSLVVVSKDPNNLKAEYEAGFIQGKLQRDQLPATRDNLWDSIERLDLAGSRGIPPTPVELEQAKGALGRNYSNTAEST